MKGITCFVFVAVIVLLLNGGSCSSDPFCDFNEGSFLTTASLYTCNNYRSLPQNLPRAGEALVLQMSDNSNTLEVIKTSALLNTGMSNLTKLYLNRCRVQKIELGAFKGGEKLTLLGLNFNKIETLDLKVFEDLPGLEALGLEGNPLKTFGNQEFPKMNLVDLYLGDCGLTEIKENLLQNLQKLKKLHLKENQLKTVDWRVFRKLKSLTLLLLQGNPWHCDCQIKFLLDYLDSNLVTWEIPTMIPECSTAVNGGSEDLVGVKWLTLNRDLLLCPPKIQMLHYSKLEAETGPVKLRCQYSGYPEPSVTWRENGIALEDPNVEKEVLDKDGAGFKFFKFKETLIVPSEKGTEGIYECKTESKAGNEVVSMRVDLPEIYSEATVKTSSVSPPTTGNGLIQQSTTPIVTSLEKEDKSDTKFWLGMVIGILIVIGVVLVLVGVAVFYLIKRLNKRNLPREIYKEVARREEPVNSNKDMMTTGILPGPPSAPEEPRYYVNPPSAGGAQPNQQNEQHIYETLDSPRTPQESYYLTPIPLPQPLVPSRAPPQDASVVFHNQGASSEFKSLI